MGQRHGVAQQVDGDKTRALGRGLGDKTIGDAFDGQRPFATGGGDPDGVRLAFIDVRHLTWPVGAFVDELVGDEGRDVIVSDGEEALNIVAVAGEDLVVDVKDIHGVNDLCE